MENPRYDEQKRKQIRDRGTAFIEWTSRQPLNVAIQKANLSFKDKLMRTSSYWALLVSADTSRCLRMNTRG